MKRAKGATVSRMFRFRHNTEIWEELSDQNGLLIQRYQIHSKPIGWEWEVGTKVGALRGWTLTLNAAKRKVEAKAPGVFMLTGV